MSRKRTPKYLTVTKSGTRARIRIHGILHQQHFSRDTDPQRIREWLLKTELKYRGARAKRTGRFKDDAAVYLAAVASMPTYEQRKQHIDEWIAVFGDEWRDRITPDQIAAQLAAWRTIPRAVKQRGGKTRTVTLSAAAVNKRRTALMHLFSVLDGKAERNPVRDVPRQRVTSPAPRSIPYAMIRQLFQAMPASKSKAHLMVLAYTGIPPGQIAQLTRADVDLDAKTVAIPGRKKGAGTLGRVMPLTPGAVQAFKLMAREDAFGPISRTVLRRVLRRAAKAVTGIEQFTPYDLRHSFGTEVYRRSGDIRATQVLMGHSSPTLTHRYTLAAVEPRVKAALTGFGNKR